MKRILSTAAVIIMTLGFGGAGIAQTTAETTDTTAPEVQAPVIAEMVIGAVDAPIEVIEYGSYTCPHCARFHAEVLPELEKNYIDTGKVRFIYREAYFDKFGLWGSLLARCGGEMRFFGISDILMKTQNDWLAGGDAPKVVENLRKIGLTAGITNEQMDVCFNDSEKVTALVTWYQDNFNRDGIDGTPSFLINGVKYPNMGYEDLAKVLDEKLAE